MSESHKRLRGRPRAFTPNPEQTMIQSLDRAMLILKALADQEGLSLTELSDSTGQAPATVYRVLSTFEAHGVVEVDPVRQLWFIGAEAFRIGSAFLGRTSLIERGRPALRELMLATGETANLAIADDGEVVFVSQVETPQPIRAFFKAGTRSAIHASGIGKAIMAHWSDDRLAALVQERGLPAFTAQTLTDVGALAVELRAIRERGWAVDDGEHTAGMRCIAAAVFNEHGEPIGGLSISGPAARIKKARDAELGRAVQLAAEHLTDAIGGRPPRQ
ncbi:MAG: IclR family transcriptional regulator [Rhizobiaceae bacterium]|nr:IclR family transcriptional regulator [Rhizobiaceae bacterium]